MDQELKQAIHERTQDSKATTTRAHYLIDRVKTGVATETEKAELQGLGKTLEAELIALNELIARAIKPVATQN